MFDVKLPPLGWFEQGNTYSGSLGTVPHKGCMNITTLCYRVSLYQNEDEKRLMAACRFQLPWNTSTNIDEYRVARFEFSEFGKSICENWIQRNYFIPENESNELKQLYAINVAFEGKKLP